MLLGIFLPLLRGIHTRPCLRERASHARPFFGEDILIPLKGSRQRRAPAKGGHWGEPNSHWASVDLPIIAVSFSEFDF